MPSHTSNQWAIAEGVQTLTSTPSWIHYWHEIRFYLYLGVPLTAILCLQAISFDSRDRAMGALLASFVPITVLGIVSAALWMGFNYNRNRRIVLDLYGRTITFYNFRLDRGQFWPWSEPRHAELSFSFDQIKKARGDIRLPRHRLQLHVQTDRGTIHVGGDMCYLEEILHILSVNCRTGECERCQANRKKNISGVCPECGTPAMV
jgi:hypothetical protein